MKDSRLTSNDERVICFDLHEKNRPVKEEVNCSNIDGLFFKEEYHFFLKQLERYLVNKSDPIKDFESENNVFAFLGARGTGKTSCMLSSASILYNSIQRESFRSLYSLVSGQSFYSLPLIEPYFQDENNSILSLVIATLYREYKRISSNNFDASDGVFSCRHELISLFSKVQMEMQQLFCPQMSGNASLERFTELSSAISLREDIRSLVDCFLKYVNMPNGILIVRIDDIDLHFGKATEMSELIRRYLIQPNMLILMSLNLEQIEQIKRKEIEQVYDRDRDKDQIEEMVERYFSKLIPHSHRVYMPLSENYLNCKLRLKLESNGQQLEYPSVRQAVPELIFQKTRYLFYNSSASTSFIVPRNLRELRQLLELLCGMEDYKSQRGVKAKDEYLFQKTTFKNYLFNNWCLHNLDSDARNIVGQITKINEIALLNKYVVSMLDKKYDLKLLNELEIHNIIDPSNKPSHISLGDILGIITYLEKDYMDNRNQKFLFILKTIYSIRLYEAYDQMTENLKPNKKGEKKKDLEVFKIKDFDCLKDYEKLLNGYLFNSNLTDWISKMAPWGTRYMIPSFAVLSLMDKCVKDWNTCAKNGLVQLAEFLMLCISYGHNNSRRTDINYRIDYELGYIANLNNYWYTFDLGCLFFNLPRVSKVYERFRFASEESGKFIDKLSENRYYKQTLLYKLSQSACSYRSTQDRDSLNIDEKDWLSYFCIRNVEVWQDFLEYIGSQISCPQSISDSLGQFFQSAASYKIKTYNKDTSKDKSEIKFDALLKIKEMLQKEEVRSWLDQNIEADRMNEENSASPVNN